jgi:hypothetical protein
MRFAIPFACLTALTALPATAQQFQGMEYDQQLNFALQDMLNSFGYACQNMGDPNACSSFNYVQSAANYMVGASNACLQGNQDGCNAYATAYQDMSATYASYSQAVYGNQMPDTTAGVAPIDPLGATHDDRMAAISNFGAANTEAFNNRMAAMDTNAAAFSDYISQ